MNGSDPRRLVAPLMLLVGACTSANDSTTSIADLAPTQESTMAPLDWRRLSEVPTPRTDGTATNAAGLIYVIGGFDANGVTLGVVEVYDPDADTWTEGPSLPVPVNHAMAAGVGDEVFVFGGNAGGGFGRPVSSALVLRDGQWQELPPMPEVRSAGGAAVVGSRIFIVGGVGADGLAEVTMVFDTAGETWSMAPGLPSRREHLGVASDGERIFAVGGRLGGTATNQATLEAFDPSTNDWARLPDQPSARGGNAATVTVGGLLVSAGGEEGFDSFDTVEAFDIAAGSWTTLPDMPTPRHGLGLEAIGNTVYALAGGPRAGLFVSGANEALEILP